jgi:hypothetical protein
MKTTKTIIILVHAFVGWALCAATMGIGMAVTSLNNALLIHAFAAPIFFAGISLVYFRKFNYTTPLQTALIFIAFVVGMDFFLVALIINRSLAMFTSLLGTWIPFGLIFTSTWLTGMRITKTRQADGEISKRKLSFYVRLIPLLIIITTAFVLLLMLLSW